MPSVKNPKLRDMMGIFGMFNEEKDKNLHSVVFLIFKDQKKKKRVERKWRCSGLGFVVFR